MERVPRSSIVFYMRRSLLVIIALCLLIVSGLCAANRTRTVLPAQAGQPGLERALNYLHYGSGHLHQIEFSRRDTQKPDQPAQRQTISDIERDSLHRETSRTQGLAASIRHR